MNEDDGGERPGGEDEGEYCRSVEAYLCRKNDGHLIRIAGPAFARVCGWAGQGVPLNVVYRGIDRYFERYYARGPRRRPVQIAFCENDVLDVFDEWRRAVGASASEERRPARVKAASPDHAAAGASPPDPASARLPSDAFSKTPRAVSLPAHLDRVIVRLTTSRAGTRLAREADAAVDRAIRELDAIRVRAASAEGSERAALTARLRALDAELVAALRGSMDADARETIDRQAREQLSPFKAGMAEEAYARAASAAATRLLRERTGLPVVEYDEP